MSYSSTEDEKFELWRYIHETKNIMYKARQKELDKYGISTSIAAVLDCLKSNSPFTSPTQIAEWMIRTPSSVSGILDRMEKAGLLVKFKDPDRKNLVRVVMTKEGEKVYEKASKRKSINKMLSCLSKEERQQLMTCLKKMRMAASKQL